MVEGLFFKDNTDEMEQILELMDQHLQEYFDVCKNLWMECNRHWNQIHIYDSEDSQL